MSVLSSSCFRLNTLPRTISKNIGIVKEAYWGDDNIVSSPSKIPIVFLIICVF